MNLKAEYIEVYKKKTNLCDLSLNVPQGWNYRDRRLELANRSQSEISNKFLQLI